MFRVLPSTGRAACACRACRSGRAAARRMKSIVFGVLYFASGRGRTRGARRRARRPASTPGAGSTTAFTSSPQSSCGMPKTATSPTFGCVEQHALDLGRVDVDAARDDHVDLAVAEEQVAVVVEVADVADGEEAGRGAPSSVFSLSLWYSKSACAALHVDGAGRARAAARCPRRRRSGSRRSAQALPTVPGFLQPLLRRDERAAALGGGVVLVDRVAPPVDHAPLDVGRAGRRGVDHACASTSTS